MERRKVIIDCDGGTDDALALVILIAAHNIDKIEIIGITCVNGNTNLDNVVKNVFRTLQICNASSIPVFKGAHSPFLATENAKRTAMERFHGTDGFGDIYTDEPDISRLQTEHAVDALHGLTANNPGEVTVICLGPLTNIALTIKMFPKFLEFVKDFYIMGGNHTAQGNITAQAEFNFYADPESVHMVLSSNDKPLWLIPWETCLRSNISHKWRHEVFSQIDTPVVKMMNDIEHKVYSQSKKVKPFYSPCDAFVAGVFLRPDMAKTVVEYHADIELNGMLTRGQVVLDHLKSNKPNVYLITDIDFELFQELLIFAANPLMYKKHII
ncbi:uncharacterized protein C1683.06c [Cephus cinctus]|uniref:Uncharacterized protein C1683.06c n=1 Tax=Cephus cinctus TaxID=211228 RepID=A0AAJ7C7X4_CEPCN|nr:uncharacterized protein C1683.06c [Cephus cinctus]XP_015603974.1 uncharacterized protein C1683.06c [Cephus cinctus]XP_015603975.1 uncharacterized protein C1683.06c [Cephus cinctus]XP_015603976.1 uncharacterized protein C1683.06c [Cephus cinctus]XP_024944943.1 uncharacterized protein C1683.06c [Cephus cinctus]XP_024944944.1 uncharacterized protein C1683.06c [Cephus cinctus]